MVKLVGPVMSLAASGKYGDALFYYDTKVGARLRSPKKQFTPPGNVWVVNQEFFKAASARSRTFSKDIKLAWLKAYPDECDAWRDIFMGHQIEAWNVSPLNDLTWPQVAVPSVEPLVFRSSGGSVNEWYLAEWSLDIYNQWWVGTLWWLILDNSNPPNSSTPCTFKTGMGFKFNMVAGRTNYMWGGVRLVNGGFVAHFLKSYFFSG